LLLKGSLVSNPSKPLFCGFGLNGLLFLNVDAGAALYKGAGAAGAGAAVLAM